MLKNGTVLMINEMALEGKSAYAISKALDISKATAAKYMAEPPKQHGLTGIKKPSILDTYKYRINQLMRAGVFNCVSILEDIQKLGYPGHMSILKAYVSPYRHPKGLPAVRRYETAYGFQAQMDWGVCDYLDEKNQLHHVACFAMVLGASRMRYIEFAKRCDLPSLERCMLNAFKYFGGVPKTVLTDNMKTVVDRREGKKIIWNEKFAAFAADIGFVPKVCRVRRPETKGKVERLVRYVKDSFIPGRVFSSINDLNAQANAWCDRVNNKEHGTTGKIPAEELLHEELKSLPSQDIIDSYRWEDRHVQRDGRVSYDGILYGVPWQYSGRYVKVRKCGGTIEIYYKSALIASHKIPDDRRKIMDLPGQYSGLTEHKGRTQPVQCAYQSTSAVESRSLMFYERIMEADNCAGY